MLADSFGILHPVHNSLEVLPLEGEIFGDFCTDDKAWVCHERPPKLGDVFS